MAKICYIPSKESPFYELYPLNDFATDPNTCPNDGILVNLQQEIEFFITIFFYLKIPAL